MLLNPDLVIGAHPVSVEVPRNKRVERFVLVGEGEREGLEKILVVVKAEAVGLLEKREDGEIQRMHIEDVYQNALLIWKPKSDEERQMAELFAWAHDIGKWVGSDEAAIELGDDGALQKKLGFGQYDMRLYQRFIDARQKYREQPGYEVERDIAHHLIGAVWFAKKAEELGLGETVFARRIGDAIIDHQFGGYYSIQAEKLGYVAGAIVGLTKMIPQSDGFAREMRVADLVAMAQIGRIEGDDVKVGGFMKLVLINAGLFPREPAKKWLVLSYVSVVEGETEAGILPEGRSLYAAERGRVDRFRQWVGGRLDGLGTLSAAERVDLAKKVVKEFLGQDKPVGMV